MNSGTRRTFSSCITAVFIVIFFTTSSALGQQPPLLECGVRLSGNVGGCSVPVPGSCPAFSIRVPERHAIELTVTAANFAPIVTLFSPDGTLLVQDSNPDADRIAIVQYSGGGIGGDFFAVVDTRDRSVTDGPFTVELKCPIGPCFNRQQTLCLAGQFEILLDVVDHRTGTPGNGVARPINEMAGYFTVPDLTGNPNNPEVFVKIVDARSLMGQYWFFYGVLSDLDAVLTVVDHSTGQTRSYRKPGGSFCGSNAAFDSSAIP